MPELVVCAKVCPALPGPSSGMELSVLPLLFLRVFLGSVPLGLTPQAARQLGAAQADPAQDAVDRALADAGAGVVLRYLPVTMPAPTARCSR